MCTCGNAAWRIWFSRLRRVDTVGKFPKQRTYAFYPAEFKELTRLRLNSPTVSSPPKAHGFLSSELNASTLESLQTRLHQAMRSHLSRPAQQISLVPYLRTVIDILPRGAHSDPPIQPECLREPNPGLLPLGC